MGSRSVGTVGAIILGMEDLDFGISAPTGQWRRIIAPDTDEPNSRERHLCNTSFKTGLGEN